MAQADSLRKCLRSCRHLESLHLPVLPREVTWRGPPACGVETRLDAFSRLRRRVEASRRNERRGKVRSRISRPCVHSEPTKPAPDPRVVAWLRAHEPDIAVDPVILGELRFGILILPKGREQFSNVVTFVCSSRLLAAGEKNARSQRTTPDEQPIMREGSIYPCNECHLINAGRTSAT